MIPAGRVHQFERGVDVFQAHDMGDHRVDFDFAVHVPVDDLWHIGAAFGAAERGAAPVAAGDELERARADFAAGFGDADDDAGAPAAAACSRAVRMTSGRLRRTCNRRHRRSFRPLSPQFLRGSGPWN